MTIETPALIRNKDELLTWIAAGNRVDYLFFWGHKKNLDGTIGKTCLSQWYEVGFVIEGIHYPSAEHYMMAEKARLFDDPAALEKILEAKHPADAKKHGRSVKGYQENIWRRQRFDIVVRGNRAKFSQNAELKTFLLNTAKCVLVEASPQDRIWGIGLEENHADAQEPAKWRGLNLLGFALNVVRERIVNTGS